MKYLWRKKKKKGCYHIGTNIGTLCRLENSTAFRTVDMSSETPPPNRSLCANCASVSDMPYAAPIPQTRGRARKSFYSTREWRTLRYEILKMSGGECSLCGTPSGDGVSLCVDHIKPIKTHPHLKLDPKNLQVLCNSCNLGKGSWDTTDWR